MEKLDLYEGDTKADWCKSWLMSKGIEEETLEHIRSVNNSKEKLLKFSTDKILFDN